MSVLNNPFLNWVLVNLQLRRKAFQCCCLYGRMYQATWGQVERKATNDVSALLGPLCDSVTLCPSWTYQWPRGPNSCRCQRHSQLLNSPLLDLRSVSQRLSAQWLCFSTAPDSCFTQVRTMVKEKLNSFYWKWSSRHSTATTLETRGSMLTLFPWPEVLGQVLYS